MTTNYRTKKMPLSTIKRNYKTCSKTKIYSSKNIKIESKWLTVKTVYKVYRAYKANRILIAPPVWTDVSRPKNNLSMILSTLNKRNNPNHNVNFHPPRNESIKQNQ